MAVIWHKQVGSTRYEVRSAGSTRRLYTNGILHSQYNSARPLTGSIWDLFLISAFFHDPASVRRVLVLGVGGGAVIRQLQHFLDPELIVGVDLSATHLQIARRFFGVRASSRVRLVEADAVRWMTGYRGAPFDLIVEDLFREKVDDAVRAVPADAYWVNALNAGLSEQGTLVMNFGTTGELRESAGFTNRRVRKHFRAIFQLTTPLNENGVGVFLRRVATSKLLRENLAGTPGLNPRLKSTRLRYSVRRL